MDELAVRLGVHELIAAYAECIDEDRLEEWPDLFVEQCRYLITSRANHEAGMRQGVMYAASRGMLLDRVFSHPAREYLRAAPLPPHRRPDPAEGGRGRRWRWCTRTSSPCGSCTTAR